MLGIEELVLGIETERRGDREHFVVHRLLTLGRGLRSTAKTLKAEMRTPELAEACASRKHQETYIQ